MTHERAAASGAEDRGADAGAPAPVASFIRSNSGWTVNVSLPEAATQFGYRVGEPGKFTDPACRCARSAHRARMPKTISGSRRIRARPNRCHLARQTRRAGRRVPDQFRSEGRAASEQKATLEELWTAGRVPRFPGQQVYFSQLITYRCAIKEVRYGSMGAAGQDVRAPACDPADPHSVPYEAKVLMKVRRRPARCRCSSLMWTARRPDARLQCQKRGCPPSISALRCWSRSGLWVPRRATSPMPSLCTTSARTRKSPLSRANEHLDLVQEGAE